jgi:tryptophanyl-tRNA synthetase
MEGLKINPWEVSSEIKEQDYPKLIKEFGAKLIDDKLLDRLKKITGDLHPFLTSRLFFAHRDLDVVLDDYSKGNEFYLYTGRGPSGKMHLGHLLPFIFTKWLQDKFDVDLLIQITDDEKYLVKDISMDEIRKNTQDNILDILSLGFNKERTHIIVDSEQSKILYNNAIMFAKKLTASTAKAVFGLKDSDNVGKYFFTSMQAVPAFLLSAIKGRNVRCLIPYGIDQDDHFKIARDILPKLGYYKPSAIISKLMPSLQGTGKMSSSDPNSAIFLDDDEETVKKKINKYAFSGGRDTKEEQRKYGANPDVDFAFNMYRALEPDQGKVSRAYADYKSGKILSGEMKAMSSDAINKFLSGLRERKEQIKGHVGEYMFDVNRFKD